MPTEQKVGSAPSEQNVGNAHPTPSDEMQSKLLNYTSNL